MKSDYLMRIAVLLFVAAFFTYLFGPLVTMGLTAFNSSEFPRVTPWDCFSVEWFNVLAHDNELMHGVRNSLIIGIGVIALSVPTGLAGALMLTQIGPRIRPWYYTIVIAPILIPGVVLGISTLVFWDSLGRLFQAGENSIFYNGLFLTIVGQSAFISSYSMLVFISRLQRFDPALEEAALDLGATHVQAFRKVLLPFLKPAIGSAAVLGFLASFENYNTTVFTVLTESTLTTVLASKVRYGINPSISALAVAIVALTLIGAVVFEIAKRREQAESIEASRVARGEIAQRAKRRGIWADPVLLMFIAICVAAAGGIYLRGTTGVTECKANVLKARRAATQRKIKELRARRMFQQAAPSEQTGTAAGSKPQQKIEAEGTKGYRNVFAPQNLEEQASGKKKKKIEAPGTKGYSNVFAPRNLEKQAIGKDKAKE